MKTITMDFEIYEKELRDKYYLGIASANYALKDFFKQEKTLIEYIKDTSVLNDHVHRWEWVFALVQRENEWDEAMNYLKMGY